MAFWTGLSFQSLLGVVCSDLESLHDFVMVWMLVILIVVLNTSVQVYEGSNKGLLLSESETLEKTWTIIPVFILISIAIPSLSLLCLQDTVNQNLTGTIKIVSNQWNWQSSSSEEDYDHLVDTSGILDVSSSFEVPIILHTNTFRVLVSSTDVLHSLGVPSLGVKLDSTPGRLNATIVDMIDKGLFEGFCFELCGSGHSMMPLSFLIL